jgi:adenine-specific DNA-methyltransferase
MKKLTAEDTETKSPDIVAENIEQLKALFPEAFTEGKVDFDVLGQLLGGAVDEREEKYGLNWHGKRRARQIALTPSTGTLRPCPEDSVDWDTTRNLMIEGDNLEVLKLFQKSYAGKVKLIYIDPPYNTGKDFVYPDNFQDNIRNYLELTGQVDGNGNKISSNTEASGRFHTDWLNMMYPRLKLARNLLRDDGAIFVSIDDQEVGNLRSVCDEVFGQENFVVPIIWQKRTTPENRRAFSFEHDYVLCYAKSADVFGETRRLLPFTDEARSRYRNPDNDPRGDWQSIPAIAQAGHGTKAQFYKLKTPDGRELDPPSGCCWRYTEQRMIQEIAENRIWFGADGKGVPRIKRYLSDTRQGITPSTMWSAEEAGSNEQAKKQVSELLSGEVVFDSPKPTKLIRRMLDIVTEGTDGDIVVDFFSGSGTAGHAVMAQNAADGGNRRFVLVQLPEPLENEERRQESALAFCDKLGKPRNIAELTKERLRRAATAVRQENPMFAGDLGFRVFKLDSSNIRAWEPDRENLPKTLEESAEHLKTDRTEADILFELLLKLGLDLTVPMEQKTIAGKTVHSIGAGTLLVCLATQIVATEVEPLALGIVAWHKQLAPAGESTVVFRDSAFADDVAKANLTAILQQHGLENVRSL